MKHTKLLIFALLAGLTIGSSMIIVGSEKEDTDESQSWSQRMAASEQQEAATVEKFYGDIWSGIKGKAQQVKEKYQEKKKELLQEKVIQITIPIFDEKIIYKYHEEEEKGIERDANGHPILDFSDLERTDYIDITIPFKGRFTSNISFNDIKEAITRALDEHKTYREIDEADQWTLWVKVAAATHFQPGFIWSSRETDTMLAPSTIKKSIFLKNKNRISRIRIAGRPGFYTVSDIYYAPFKNLPQKLRNKIPINILFKESSQNSAILYAKEKDYNPLFILVKRKLSEEELETLKKKQPLKKEPIVKSFEQLNDLVNLAAVKNTNIALAKGIQSFMQSKEFTQIKNHEMILNPLKNTLFAVFSIGTSIVRGIWQLFDVKQLTGAKPKKSEIIKL